MPIWKDERWTTMRTGAILLICAGGLLGLFALLRPYALGTGAAAGAAVLMLGGSAILFWRYRLAQQSSEHRFAAAIEHGRLRQMQRMLDAGEVNPNGRAPDGQKSWLRYAIERGAVAPCQILLGRGADPNLPDGGGSSVLDYLSSTNVGSSQLESIRLACEKARRGRRPNDDDS